MFKVNNSQKNFCPRWPSQYDPCWRKKILSYNLGSVTCTTRYQGLLTVKVWARSDFIFRSICCTQLTERQTASIAIVTLTFLEKRVEVTLTSDRYLSSFKVPKFEKKIRFIRFLGSPSTDKLNFWLPRHENTFCLESCDRCSKYVKTPNFAKKLFFSMT